MEFKEKAEEENRVKPDKQQINGSEVESLGSFANSQIALTAAADESSASRNNLLPETTGADVKENFLAVPIQPDRSFEISREENEL